MTHAGKSPTDRHAAGITDGLVRYVEKENSVISFFRTNEHPIERVVRVLVGIGLLGIAFFGPKTPWGFIGILPLLTGAFGTCPAYSLLGISTCGVGSGKAN